MMYLAKSSIFVVYNGDKPSYLALAFHRIWDALKEVASVAVFVLLTVYEDKKNERADVVVCRALLERMGCIMFYDGYHLFLRFSCFIRLGFIEF